MHQKSSNSDVRADDVINGLRDLARIGKVTPDAVLAVRALADLPLEMGRAERGPDAAITVSQAIMRAMESTHSPAAARLLFGADDLDVVQPLGKRRSRAAKALGITPGSFRVRREPRVLGELARALLVELIRMSQPPHELPQGAHLEIESNHVRANIPITATSSPITIGRAPSCDIELRYDPWVSRRHAQLRVLNGAWIVEDLGSANGTESETGAVMGHYRLRDGDVMTIGRTRLRFRINDHDPASTMSS